MVQTPLRNILIEFARQRAIELTETTLPQYINSGTLIHEDIRYRLDILSPTFRKRTPIMFVGKNNDVSLSYLWEMVGLVGLQITGLDYHPAETLVAEGRDRTLTLHVETGRSLGKRVSDLYYQLEDKMLLRILPPSLKKDNPGIVYYSESLNLTQKNMEHMRKLLNGLF